ncbi:Mini-ribonuclease 3 [Alkalibacterium iburiense]|uniref:Mini-ribonuclease 3 n=1 Tax=Alkalibacterium iburiense TaxID=290589 RepID=A0ABN0XCQ8_9LACT
MSNSQHPRLLNGLALAYMGDAVYELAIREHLISKGQTKPHMLHRLATEYVSAKGQAYLSDKFQEQDKLTDEEWDYFKRGRNAKSHSKAKNADTQTYSQSTGFEALMGYLYLTDQHERLNELIIWCIDRIEEKQ